jgi:phosphoglycerate kinase
MKNIYDEKLKGKTIVLRADLNSPIVSESLALSSRIREHAKTIYFLSEEEAKTVVLSHQGREGEPDFVDLYRHSRLIEKLIDKPVKFVKWNEDYAKEIKNMKNGEIILLDNVRFLKEETEKKTIAEHAKANFIKKIAKNSDLFVQDALSVCHRSQASVVGFKPHLPCFTGIFLEKELNALEKLSEINDSTLLVLGGGKPADSIKVLEEMLTTGKANEALLGGMIGELFLKAKGIELGKKDEYYSNEKYTPLLKKAQKIMNTHEKKIMLPIDFAFEENKTRKEIPLKKLPAKEMILDIGQETLQLYKNKIRSSKLTIFNGPMGVYEKNGFARGTKKILEYIAFSRTFSILGGGDTEKALTAIGLVPQDFNHVSLAGKALLEYLAGKKLPGLEILDNNKQ